MEKREAEDMESKVFDTSRIQAAPKDLKEAESKLPEMKQDQEAAINFTRIEANYPQGSSAGEITKHSIDLSYKLDMFMRTQLDHVEEACRHDDDAIQPSDDINNRRYYVLGELQFAFVCFLVGNVYDGFEQWKSLVSLMCNSEAAIRARPSMYLALLNVLYYQLNEMPLDFFTDITTSNNFLVVHLHNLFENIRDVCSSLSWSESIEDEKKPNQDDVVLDKMRKRCDQLKNYLQEKFKFDFDEEPDEYAPTVVLENDE